MPAQIPLVYATRLPGLQITPQRGEAVLDVILGNPRIEQEKAALYNRIPVRLGIDFVFGEVSRTQQDRMEGLPRKATRIDLVGLEDEEIVAASGDSTLDLKEFWALINLASTRSA